MINFTFLGTGTSGGVPEIGCSCSVCQSDDPKDKRTRCSSYIEKDGVKILIDTSIDFRLQALREKISRVDAVFLTHPHADHCLGIDDLRSIQFQQGFPIDFFARAEHLKDLQQAFSYLFTGPEQKGGGVVKINPFVFSPGLNHQITYKGLNIRALNIHHGILKINAYVIDEKIAYITDCHSIDEAEWKSIYKVPVLIINCLRYKPHKTHLDFKAACQLIKQIKPDQAYFIHITHDISHRLSRWRLPANCQLAYDGLQFTI